MRQDNTPQVLTFTRHEETAYAVTNGTATRSYIYAECKEHSSLLKAVSYLEAKGFSIVTDAPNYGAPW